MQLSKNFTLAEFSHSETAARKGIDNTIPAVCVGNIKVLVEQVLQPARDLFRRAIRVTSGYRCAALNRAVGGAANSQHMTGEAVDIVAADGSKASMMRLFVILMDGPFDQLIWEKGGQWIHVSFCQRKNRQQVIFT